MTRDLGVDPIGTAGSYDGFLVIEHPLPWARDVSEDPVLGLLHETVQAAVTAGELWRIQVVVPRSSDPDAERSIVAYRRPPGWFAGYARTVATARANEVSEAALALVAASSNQDGEPSSEGDLLICTHGRRDICCGKLGTSLAVSLPSAINGRQLWRTSHTGGHRFAPTAIGLPDGQFWAFLDADVVHRIATRDGSPADLRGHYRGSAAMATPSLQALERECFISTGWSWLSHRRAGTELGPDGAGMRGRIDFQRPDGSMGSVEGTVLEQRQLPVPACGQPIDQATQWVAELRVVDVQERTWTIRSVR